MNHKGFSLLELAMTLGLTGAIALFLMSYTQKVQDDVNQGLVWHDSQELRNKITQDLSTIDSCIQNLKPTIDAKNLANFPLHAFSSPVKINGLKNFKPGQIYGEIKIIDISLESSRTTPNVAFNQLSKSVGRDVLDDYTYTAQMVVKVLKQKAKTELTIPVALKFKNGLITDCQLSTSTASTMLGACIEMIHEVNSFTTFASENDKCGIVKAGEELRLQDNTQNRSILCKMQKKIMAIKPADGTLSQGLCL